MTEKPKYYDIREGFWRKHFERAASFDRFLEEGDPAFAERWCKNMAALPGLCPEDRARLSGHNREVNVLVYCAAWCGDCARQIPMVKMIAEAVGPGAKMRLIDRDESEELKDELRILGAMRVPVVVFLTEDFHEIGRVGDRMLSAYRRKLDANAGEACDTGLVVQPVEALQEEQAEWVGFFERMLIMLRLAPPLRARHGD